MGEDPPGGVWTVGQGGAVAQRFQKPLGQRFPNLELQHLRPVRNIQHGVHLVIKESEYSLLCFGEVLRLL